MWFLCCFGSWVISECTQLNFAPAPIFPRGCMLRAWSCTEAPERATQGLYEVSVTEYSRAAGSPQNPVARPVHDRFTALPPLYGGYSRLYGESQHGNGSTLFFSKNSPYGLKNEHGSRLHSRFHPDTRKPLAEVAGGFSLCMMYTRALAAVTDPSRRKEKCCIRAMQVTEKCYVHDVASHRKNRTPMTAPAYFHPVLFWD